jgi:hypothetical protein
MRKVVIFLCFVSSDALKLSASDALAEICEPSYLQAELGDIAKNVKDFWEQRNITIYPAVLTMVTAMRYGSMGVMVDGQKHVLDHDMDFMLIEPKWMGNEMREKMVKEWQQSVTDELKLKTSLESPVEFWRTVKDLHWLLNWADSNYFLRTVKGSFEGTIIALHRKTALTDKLNEDGIQKDGRWVEKRWNEMNGKISEMPQRLQLLTRTAAESSITQVNYWYPHTPQEGMKAHPTKKTLLMGQTFSFPVSEQSIFTLLLDEWGSHHAASDKTFCDFALPAGIYEEDMPVSERTREVTKQCINRLHDAGYQSFKHCL